MLLATSDSLSFPVAFLSFSAAFSLPLPLALVTLAAFVALASTREVEAASVGRRGLRAVGFEVLDPGVEEDFDAEAEVEETVTLPFEVEGILGELLGLGEDRDSGQEDETAEGAGMTGDSKDSLENGNEGDVRLSGGSGWPVEPSRDPLLGVKSGGGV